MFLLESCKSVKPEKPEENYIEKAIERPSSWLNIPIEIPLAQIEDQINKEIAGLIYEDTSFENNGNDMLMFKVWKKDRIRISFKEDAFYFDLPLKIWAKAGFKAESFGIDLSQEKATEMELNVRLKSVLGVNSQWKIAPVTTAAGHQWFKRPVVKIGFFEISLAPILDQVLQNQQGSIAKELDKEIQNRIQIKPYVQEAWEQIQQPFELSQQINAWLKITPSEIMMTPLTVRNNQIVTNIGIKGYVDTFFGNKPEFTLNTNLPPLQTIKQVQERFQIALTGQITHDYAKSLVEQNFVGQTYSFNKGKRQIKITGIDLYGSNGKLVIKLNIDGSVKGEIYLKGNPVFDQNSSTLIVENLEYDIKTKNALVRVADWMNHGNFIKTIEQNLRLPLGKEIEQTKRLIRQNLNNHRVSENIVLNGKLENLIPGDVLITKEAIHARVTAEGQIQVKIEGLL